MANKKLREEMLLNWQDLYETGLATKEEVNKIRDLLIPVPNFTPKKVKQLRVKLKLSQNTFAALLNVTPSTLQKWEQGQKTPSNSARKLLHLTERQGIGVLLNCSGS